MSKLRYVLTAEWCDLRLMATTACALVANSEAGSAAKHAVAGDRSLAALAVLSFAVWAYTAVRVWRNMPRGL